jgi:Lon-like ATP-dependent protease
LTLLFVLQLSEDPLQVAAVHLKNESYVNDDNVKATSMELVNTMKDLLNMNPLYGEQFKTLMSLTGVCVCVGGGEEGGG